MPYTHCAIYPNRDKNLTMDFLLHGIYCIFSNHSWSPSLTQKKCSPSCVSRCPFNFTAILSPTSVDNTKPICSNERSSGKSGDVRKSGSPHSSLAAHKSIQIFAALVFFWPIVLKHFSQQTKYLLININRRQCDRNSIVKWMPF